MPARRPAEVADFALDPHILQAIIQIEQLTNVTREIGNSDRAGSGLRLSKEAVLHEEIVVGMTRRSKWGYR